MNKKVRGHCGEGRKSDKKLLKGRKGEIQCYEGSEKADEINERKNRGKGKENWKDEREKGNKTKGGE